MYAAVGLISQARIGCFLVWSPYACSFLLAGNAASKLLCPRLHLVNSISLGSALQSLTLRIKYFHHRLSETSPTQRQPDTIPDTKCRNSSHTKEHHFADSPVLSHGEPQIRGSTPSPSSLPPPLASYATRPRLARQASSSTLGGVTIATLV